VFAVAPRHALARHKGPLPREAIRSHRAVVVADTARAGTGMRSYGVQGGQPQLAVPGMAAKIAAQRAGLGVGWLPRQRVAGLLKSGQLVACETADPREPNTLYVAWRGAQQGRALQWWLDRLREPRLARRLVDGIALS